MKEEKENKWGYNEWKKFFAMELFNVIYHA